MSAPSSQDGSQCCNGRCRRNQPPMVMRSGLTGTWWVVLRYRHLGGDSYEALDKHQLAAESVAQLEELWALWNAEEQEQRDVNARRRVVGPTDPPFPVLLDPPQ